MIPIGIYDDATNFKEISAAMAKDENERATTKAIKYPSASYVRKNAIFEQVFNYVSTTSYSHAICFHENFKRTSKQNVA